MCACFILRWRLQWKCVTYCSCLAGHRSSRLDAHLTTFFLLNKTSYYNFLFKCQNYREITNCTVKTFTVQFAFSRIFLVPKFFSPLGFGSCWKTFSGTRFESLSYRNSSENICQTPRSHSNSTFLSVINFVFSYKFCTHSIVVLTIKRP